MNGDLTTATYWDQTWTTQAPRSLRLLDRLRQVTQWKFDRMLGRLVDAIGKPEADILELGCAPGTILERIHRLRPGHRLHGIDFAPDGCRMAQERFAAAGLSVTLHQGDVRTLMLPRRYDLVLSCGFIEHFADPVEILCCHTRFAAPGGLVAVTVPNFAAPVVRFFLRRFHPEVFATHNFAIMSPPSLGSALRAAGLRDVVVGSDGGAQLLSDVSRPGFAGNLYRRAAQAWNIVMVPMPGGLWQANVWGLGRVTANDPDEER
jgi:2-polyprenyl-3-methyl-5-hydroxy-6-metoxy-1,4-benzoquinol methylase